MQEIREQVHIILVNYGNWQDTSQCLLCLESHLEFAVEVIIVDIENRDGSRARLRETMDGLTRNRYRLLEQAVNRGFAHACNAGIRLALDKDPDCLIWLLNNDTLIRPGSLPGLIKCYQGAKEDPRRIPGFIGSVIIHPGKGERIQYAGGIIDPAKVRLTVHSEGVPLTQIEELHGCSGTEWVMGASMFFHSSLIRSIGYMPEEYFLYYEDIDWSLRALKHGYLNLISRDSVIIHKQGSSTGQDYNSGERVNPVTTWHYYNSYLMFFKKNYPSRYCLAKAMLLKQMAGKLYRGDLRRFTIILKVLLGIGPEHRT